ncbi:hypothetical protein HY492_02520 [Candidatus Woesearchaeota archaeon]|nr:hypothetical protein [Candidatus Woesearchaeota archaeon]
MLVLAVVTVIFITNKGVVFRTGIVVDREAQPVYDYVSSCMSTIAEEGIRLQGLQGGFLRIPVDIERTPSSYLPVDGRGILKVPLWFYEGESVVPSIALMESDLARHVEENLPACLENFSAFQYPVVEKSSPDASVTIGEGSVTVRLAYEVEIQRPERMIEVKEFVIQPNVNLKRAYDLAVKVMQKEDDEAWFENLTLDLMTGTPDIPFNSLEFDCSPRVWKLTDVKQDLQEIMQVNLPTVRVLNTQHAPFDEKTSAYEKVLDYKLEDFFQDRYPKSVPEDQFEYARMRFDAGIPKSPLAAAFLYQPEWGMDLNAQPNKGGVLSSKVGKGAQKYLSYLCVNTYHFIYDVIYPVMFRATDENAFQNRGFAFQMAFPVIINDNTGARRTFGYRDFRGFEQSLGFCDNLGDDVIEVRASGLEPEIGVIEQGGVTVRYTCVNQECVLGTTAADSGFYRLRARMPEGCINPEITVEKDGYLPVSKTANTDTLEFVMPKLREMKIQIMKVPYDAENERYLLPRPLGKNDQVTVQLSLVNGTYDQYVTFPAANNTLNVIEGTGLYELNAILTQFDTLVGGYSNPEYRIMGRELSATDTLTLYVMEVSPIKKDRDYQISVGTFLNEGDYRESWKPKLS